MSGAATPPVIETTDCLVIELRQYTLKQGQRDVLIDIFERHFIESQESVGACIIGQFRDLDAPDRFVWLRGFRDMPSRKLALEAFYKSAIWARQREAVNETLLDSENVLLLRPARPGSGFKVDRRHDPVPVGRQSLVAATICSLDAPASGHLVEFVEQELPPRLAEVGGTLLATLVTEPSENNYPRLAIREGENVLVWFSHFPDRDSHRLHMSEVERWPDMRVTAPGSQVLRLAAASRSRLA